MRNRKEGLNRIRAHVLKFLIVCIFIMVSSVSATAFDANDYDYDSGSSCDYSYDYDSGSDWDSDFGSSSDYSSSDSSSHSYSPDDINEYRASQKVAVVATLVFTGIILFVIIIGVTESSRLRKKYGPPKQVNRMDYKSRALPNRNIEIENIMKQNEPDFNANDFNRFAETVWRRIQSAWCAKDLEPVRNLLGFNLYNTTQKQIQDKIDRHIKYHYENINFIETYLTSYIRDAEFEYLTVYTKAEYIDYQTDELTGQIIKGDTMAHWRIDYKMKFQRSLKSFDTSYVCPNCGAGMDITSSSKCLYCGTVITNTSSDWILCDFTSVRDDTVDDGIRI